MKTSKISSLFIIAVMAMFSACTVSKTPAPLLQGPSTLGLALNITASPDVLSMDGASQSLIVVDARDENGQPKANVQLRAEIHANGQAVDFGSLSARTVVTGANGRATVTYTAPVGSSGPIPTLDIFVTPGGTDTNSGFPSAQFIAIRLVPPGTITGGGPNPSFTVVPASPAAFTDTLFDASASTSSLGASIVSYSWNFGDGGTATGRTATHRFSSSSTFRTTLTVTDSNGAAASTSKDIVVGAGTGSTANFTFSPTTPVVNQTINFNGGLSTAGAGHSIVRYAWDFGNGATQTGVTVSQSYDTAGTYNVTLTTTDEVGQMAQSTKSVTVTAAGGGAGAGAPTAKFTFSPAAPGVGDTVFFNASTSTAGAGHSIASYAWTFGDGAVASGVQPTHAYSASGSYAVQLTVTDNAGQSTTSGSTTVAVGNPPAPTASFTFSPASPGRNDQVVFDASSTTTAQGQTIVDVAWNFGDGTAVIHCPGGAPADCPGPTNRISAHTFATNQTFQVNLVVTDSAGRTGSKSVQVAVALASPTVVASASPSSSKGPVLVFFNSDATTYFPDGSGPASFSWSFGDGGTCSTASFPVGCGGGTAADPGHLYPAAPGATNVIYNITLSVTDTKGRTGVGSTTVTITP